MRKKHLLSRRFILLNQRKPTWKIALRISILYLLFGILWISLSDYLMIFLVRDALLLNKIGTLKGFLFVAISAAVFFILIAPSLKKLSDNEQVITENRNELKLMVYYDYLTGLSNRRKLLERLPEFLEEKNEIGKAVLYLDMDNIKLINDTLGHKYGDALIAETSRQLLSMMETGDELYRHGGDEFIILTSFRNIADLERRTELILKRFESPFSIDNIQTHSRVSIGIALYPLHSTDPVELMKCADIAMYQSKKLGKNRSVLYNSQMMEKINEAGRSRRPCRTASRPPPRTRTGS